MYSSEMGQKLIRFAESTSYNIVLYSRFIWLNGSVALTRAERESYHIMRLSKVTTNQVFGLGNRLLEVK